jgi:hypothetical protein
MCGCLLQMLADSTDVCWIICARKTVLQLYVYTAIDLSSKVASPNNNKK